MKRRRFLGQVVSASVGVASGGFVLAAQGCMGLRYAPGILNGNRLSISRSEFLESEHVLVDHPSENRAIYVRKVGEDRFAALSTRCTHRGCQVEPQGDRLACPCHGSEFSFNGQVLEGPAEESLARYEVEAGTESITIVLTGV